MMFLKPKDAEFLNNLANAEESGLRDAVDNYGNETHFIGFIEGMVFVCVDIVGVWAAYKIASKASDAFCEFGKNAVSEFLHEN